MSRSCTDTPEDVLGGVYLSAYFTQQVVMGILSALWAIWLHDLGSYTYVDLTMTVFALPQIFLGALAGRVGDRWGRAPLLFGVGLLVSVVYASYGFMTNLTLIVIVGVLEGIFIVVQRPAAQSLLADGVGAGRAQGGAGTAGALGGSLSAFAALPLYHASRPVPFLLARLVMTVGSMIAASGALVLTRRQRARRAAVTRPSAGVGSISGT